MPDQFNLVDGNRTTLRAVNDELAVNVILGQYDRTLFVDPNGSVDYDGSNPAEPTTLAKALSVVEFGDCIVMGDGTYVDTDGPGTGTLTLPESNVTFTNLQGGTGSNSAIINDTIVIPDGQRRLRAFGVRFDGDIQDNSDDGQHYFSRCSAGDNTSIIRTNPAGGMSINNCEFSSMSIQCVGTAAVGASLTVTGSANSLGPITIDCDGFAILANNTILGKLTINGSNCIVNAGWSTFIDSVLPIEVVNPINIINLKDCVCANLLGQSLPVSIASPSAITNTTFDYATSSLGISLAQPTFFGGGLYYNPGNPSDWSGSPPQSLGEAIDRIAASIGPVL